MFLACLLTLAQGVPVFRVEPWPEAERLFRGDPRWVGADGAYSVDLGGERSLWLFADSVIDPTGQHARTSPGVTLISNTVAVQSGRDPAHATATFSWRTRADGAPAAFYPDRGAERFWPGHGVRLDDRLLLFWMRVERVEGGLGFEVTGHEACLVRNPDAAPLAWELEPCALPDPSTPLGGWRSARERVVLGAAGVLRQDGFVIAFGSHEPGGRLVSLARWPEEAARRGDLRAPAWWCGTGWEQGEEGAHHALPALSEAQTELTVHRDPRSGAWLRVQTQGFGCATLTLRTGPTLCGPWSPPAELFRPPECDVPGALVYQGKAHPELTGADLVLTYSTNHATLEGLMASPELYWPRFLRATRVEAR